MLLKIEKHIFNKYYWINYQNRIQGPMIKLQSHIDDKVDTDFSNIQIQEHSIPIHHDRSVVQKYLNDNVSLQKDFPGIELKEHGVEWTKHGFLFLMSWLGNLHVSTNSGPNGKKIRISNPKGKIILKNVEAEHMIIMGDVVIKSDNETQIVSINNLDIIGSLEVKTKLTAHDIRVQSIINHSNAHISANQIISDQIENHGLINVSDLVSKKITNHGTGTTGTCGTICSENEILINCSETFENNGNIFADKISINGSGNAINNHTIKCKDSISILIQGFTNKHFIHSQGIIIINSRFENLASLTVIGKTIITGNKRITNISNMSSDEKDKNKLMGFVLSDKLEFKEFTGTFDNQGFVTVQGDIIGSLNVLCNQGLFGTDSKFDLSIKKLEATKKSNIVGTEHGKLMIQQGENLGVIAGKDLVIEITESMTNNGLLDIETLTTSGESGKMIFGPDGLTKIKHLITESKFTEINGNNKIPRIEFRREWKICSDAQIECNDLYIGWWGENHGLIISKKIESNAWRLKNSDTIQTDSWIQLLTTGSITNGTSASLEIKKADIMIGKLINQGEINICKGNLRVSEFDNTGKLKIKEGLFKFKNYIKMGQITIDEFEFDKTYNNGIYFDKRVRINKMNTNSFPLSYLIVGASTVIKSSRVYINEIDIYGDLTFDNCSVYCTELKNKSNKKLILKSTELFVSTLSNQGIIQTDNLSIKTGQTSDLPDTPLTIGQSMIRFCETQDIATMICRIEMERKAPDKAMEAIEYYNDIIENPYKYGYDQTKHQIYMNAATYELSNILLTGGKYGFRTTIATTDEKNKMINALTKIKQSDPRIKQYASYQCDVSTNHNHVVQCKQIIGLELLQNIPRTRLKIIDLCLSLGRLESLGSLDIILANENPAQILDIGQTWSCKKLVIQGNEFQSLKDLEIKYSVDLNVKKFTNQHNIKIGSPGTQGNLMIDTEFFTNDCNNAFAQLTVYGWITCKIKYNFMNLMGKIQSLYNIDVSANYFENGKALYFHNGSIRGTCGGYISSGAYLTIIADTINTSFGKLISFDDITLTAKKNINNLSGAIIGGGDININADRYYQQSGNLKFDRIVSHCTRIRDGNEYVYCDNIFSLNSEPAQMNAYNGSIRFNVNYGHLKGSTIWATNDITGTANVFHFETVSAYSQQMLVRNNGQNNDFREPDPPTYTHYVAAIQAGKYFEANVGSLILRGSVSAQHIDITAAQINSLGLPNPNNHKKAMECDIVKQIQRSPMEQMLGHIDIEPQIPWQIQLLGTDRFSKFSIPLNLFRYGVALTLSRYLGSLWIDGKSGDELIKMLCENGSNKFNQIKKSGQDVTKGGIPKCMEPFIYYEIQKYRGKDFMAPHLYLPDAYQAGEYHFEPGLQKGKTIINKSSKGSVYQGTRIHGSESVKILSDGPIDLPVNKTYTIEKKGDTFHYTEKIDGQQADIQSQGTVEISGQSINAVAPKIHSNQGTKIEAKQGNINISDLTLTNVSLTQREKQNGRETTTYRRQDLEEHSFSGFIESNGSNEFLASSSIKITNTPITATNDNVFEANDIQIKTKPVKKSTEIKTTRYVKPKRFLFWKGGGSCEQYDFSASEDIIDSKQSIISGGTTRFSGQKARLTGVDLKAQNIEDHVDQTVIEPVILESNSTETYYKNNFGTLGFNRKIRGNETKINQREVIASEIKTSRLEAGKEPAQDQDQDQDQDQKPKGSIEFRSANVQADETIVRKSMIQSMDQNSYKESRSSYQKHKGKVDVTVTHSFTNLGSAMDSAQGIMGTASQAINYLQNPLGILEPNVNIRISNQESGSKQDVTVRQDVPNQMDLGNLRLHNVPRFRIAGYTVCKTVSGHCDKFESVPIKTSMESNSSQWTKESSFDLSSYQFSHNESQCDQHTDCVSHSNSRLIIEEKGKLSIDDAEFIGLVIDGPGTEIVVHRSLIEQTMGDQYNESSDVSYLGINASLDTLESLNILGLITNCGFNSIHRKRHVVNKAESTHINARLRCDGTRQKIEPDEIDESMESVDPLGDFMAQCSHAIGFSQQVTGFCDQLNGFVNNTANFEDNDCMFVPDIDE